MAKRQKTGAVQYGGKGRRFREGSLLLMDLLTGHESQSGLVVGLVLRGHALAARAIPPPRFIGREHLQNIDVNWGHEPTKLGRARRSARAARRSTPGGTARAERRALPFRFMGSHYNSSTARENHEPGITTFCRIYDKRLYSIPGWFAIGLLDSP